MSQGCANVLLLGENAGSSFYLRRQLEQRGCQCWFARSPDEGLALFDRHTFHLVLSTKPLHQGNPLIALSEQLNCSVFCCYPVEEGWWWLPVVHHGQGCLGAPAYRASEFVAALDDIVRDIDSDVIAATKQG